MHAYYFDNLPTDQRLPHTTDPLQPVSAETLAKLGVLSWHVPIAGASDQGVQDSEIGVLDSNSGVQVQNVPEDDPSPHGQVVNAVAKARGYKNRDVINVSKEGMGAVYEEKIRGFFEEHMHEDEEIRYI
ncbi:hypothetical protein C8R45DRAFT_531238 [Mycena sanguinolenta]|nr:hypothetical protein C8R45DRAFT_531238 [Mycena sanguinolenta]